MKVQCKYCGNMINDTEAVCPHCGAPNSGVKRSVNDQPLTIEDLKKWYSDRGLPPYEVTRFFIGINYQKPRAFGIYHDENTGNYVVYKNKDNGQRAIRYEGTDEAYAVNELWQRLKQEIVQQKQHQNYNPVKQKKRGILKRWQPTSFVGRLLKRFLIIILGFLGVGAAAAALLVLVGAITTLFVPEQGYYRYEDTSYYYNILDYDSANWYAWEGREWSPLFENEKLPAVLEERKTAKPYFVQSDWSKDLPCGDYRQSVYARDLDAGLYCDRGYYSCDGKEYYHLETHSARGWYVCQKTWKEIDISDLPEVMQHSSTIRPLFQTENYSRTLPCPDFSETIFYKDYYAPTSVSKGYYQYGNAVYYHLASDYDEGWYTYRDDEWQSTEILPEPFSHPSVVEDFYFTPTWDASTQYSDFTDSAAYASDKDNWSDHSDSSFDWSSDDSWDSDFSDWDSDW